MTYDRQKQEAQAVQLGTYELKKAAKEAGLARYAVPLCGGGFTNHHRITSSGRCAECSAASRQRRKATGTRTAIETHAPARPEPLTQAALEARQAAKSAARKARREAMTPEERNAQNRKDRARRAANRLKCPRTLAS